jgi:transcriptional regulator with XRE-family HTH domain
MAYGSLVNMKTSRIFHLRKFHRLTLDQLSEKTGIPITILWRIENLRGYDPKISNVHRLMVEFPELIIQDFLP